MHQDKRQFFYVLVFLVLSLATNLAIAQMPEHLSQEPTESDTLLEEAFREPYFDFSDNKAHFYFNWRSYYLNRLVDDEPDLLALATGGWAGWYSRLFAGHLHFGVEAFTSQKLFGPKDKDGTLLLAPGQQSFSGVSDVYIDWSSERVKLRAGRFRLETPYMHSSDIRMIPLKFQGVRGLFQVSHNWMFGASYITHMKDLNSSDFVSLYKLAGINNYKRGVVTLGTSYRFHPKGRLGLITYYAPDIGVSTYAEFFREWQTRPGQGVELGLQYSHQQNHGKALAGSFVNNHYGVRLKYYLPWTRFSVAYTQMSTGGALFQPWGYAPTYNGGIVEDFTRAGEKSLSAGVSLKLSQFIHGLQLHLYYIYGRSPDNGPKASPSMAEFDATIEYSFSVAALKGFHLRIRNAYVNQRNSHGMHDARDLNDFRLILNYENIF